ncbi:hypothetical protein KPH14_000994 [Odynerus spinipes]|uniref:Retrotransposon gag domain-containing protein n=1 Tax=Odynerus spinipes TaxID=1348599 RepID=A0AAD9VLV0_9HYME|nr:hypothetical protein KPH14_000994 [Odynerus spinipes]
MAVTSATKVTFMSWAPVVTARSVTSALNPDSRPFEFPAGGSAFVLPVAHSSLRMSTVVVEEAGREGSISDRRGRGDSEVAEPIFPVAGRPHHTPCSSVGSVATSVAFGERSRGVGVRVQPERTSADRVRRPLPSESDTRNEIRSGIFPSSTLSFPLGKAVSFGPSRTEYYTPELDEDEIRERRERPTTRLGRTLGASRANSRRADRVREEYGGVLDFPRAEALRSGRLVDQLVRGWRISFSGDDDMTADEFLNRVEEESALVGLTNRELLCVIPALLSDLALDWYRLRRHQWRTWEELRTAFRARYSSYEMQERLRELVRTRTQGIDEKAERYLLQTESLLAKLVPPVPMAEQLSIAYANLRPEYQREIYPREVTSSDMLTELGRQRERI